MGTFRTRLTESHLRSCYIYNLQFQPCLTLSARRYAHVVTFILKRLVVVNSSNSIKVLQACRILYYIAEHLFDSQVVVKHDMSYGKHQPLTSAAADI